MHIPTVEGLITSCKMWAKQGWCSACSPLFSEVISTGSGSGLSLPVCSISGSGSSESMSSELDSENAFIVLDALPVAILLIFCAMLKETSVSYT